MLTPNQSITYKRNGLWIGALTHRHMDGLMRAAERDAFYAHVLLHLRFTQPRIENGMDTYILIDEGKGFVPAIATEVENVSATATALTFRSRNGIYTIRYTGTSLEHLRAMPLLEDSAPRVSHDKINHFPEPVKPRAEQSTPRVYL